MQMYVRAVGAGKKIRVIDRIAGADAFNDWVDGGSTVGVDVNSPDGQSGNIDVQAQMTASNPWVIVQNDYAVAKDETVDVEDV